MHAEWGYSGNSEQSEQIPMRRGVGIEKILQPGNFTCKLGAVSYKKC